MSHVPEPELLLPTPRPVRLRNRLETGCTTGCLQLFILPHTAGGFFFLYQFFAALYFYWAVQQSGIDLEGRVTQKIESPGKNGPYYSLDYVFTKDGQEHGGQVYVSAAVYGDTTVGDPLPLRVYSITPREGRWHLLPDQRPGRDLAGIGLFCLLWNGGFGAIYWYLYVFPLRARRLVRDGTVAVGRVMSVQAWQDKSSTAYTIRYHFDPVPPGDRPVRGSKTVRYPLSAVDVRSGDTLTVLYDPRRPRRNLLYKFANFQVHPSQSQ